MARIATLSAPYVADFQKPWPEITLLFIVSIAFVLAFTLPLDEYDDQDESHAEKSMYDSNKSMMLKGEMSEDEEIVMDPLKQD